MPDGTLDERRFTDREVREILRRAVRDAPEPTRSSRAVTRTEGLSLTELQAIGQEVGIDAARLEDAARAVALGRSRPSRGFWGGPRVLDVERTVDGTIEAERTHEVLSLVRRLMGDRGQAEEIGGALEWSAVRETGSRYVTVASREGTTTIRGGANLKNALVLTYLGPGMIGLIASMIGFGQFANSGNELGMVVALGLIVLLFPMARSVVNWISQRESKRLAGVVDEVARLVEGSGDAAAGASESEA